jgi:hypothetical protein
LQKHFSTRRNFPPGGFAFCHFFKTDGVGPEDFLCGIFVLHPAPRLRAVFNSFGNARVLAKCRFD